MKTIAAGKFKATCLKIMDDVSATREPVLITKNGRPVAKLVPADEKSSNILGCLSDVMEIVGDIESPVLPPEAWKALR
ncbi:MAG TPA: type II toxin-antitoxin system Phd/YefM family antitoxin [Terriglobia bacterium]|nr:type II toxin-antitoxin system Phd/YefM family antitoxin [Terriglobia bacterium]